MPGIYNFVINQGATFNPTLDYASPDLSVKTISNITRSAVPVVTATGHGLSGKWKVFITSVVGMDQLNSRGVTRVDKAYTAKIIDANTLSLDIDASRFNPYASGGELVFHAPINLTGYTARMQIRSSVESETVLVNLTTENGGITLGGTGGTVQLLITAVATAAITWTSGVYDLELVSGSGIVTRLVSGRINVTQEVTRG